MSNVERPTQIEQDKLVPGKGGKHRSKKEVEQNHSDDPAGHTRKLVTKMQNTEAKKKHEHSGPVSKVDRKAGSEEEATAAATTTNTPSKEAESK